MAEQHGGVDLQRHIAANDIPLSLPDAGEAL